MGCCIGKKILKETGRKLVIGFSAFSILGNNLCRGKLMSKYVENRKKVLYTENVLAN